MQAIVALFLSLLSSIFGLKSIPVPPVSTPTPTPVICGGIQGLHCSAGYYCEYYDRQYPDAAGLCLPEKSKIPKTCPTSNYIDCMPKIDSPPNPQCSPDYLTWAKANCPGFQGAAY